MDYMTRISRCLLVVLLGAAAGTDLGSQFRAGTALVTVDVVATRLDGNLARDLTRSDFQILEDGRPQEIRQFQIVDLEEPQVVDSPGVFSNRSEPGAVFALVLDDMTVAARHTGRMREWATQFLREQVRPGDYVGVMRTGVNSPLLLTTDAALVEPIIAQTSGRGGGYDVSSVTGGAGDTLPTPSGDAASTMPDFSALGLLDTSAQGRIIVEQSLTMTQRVVEYLGQIPARRKAVLLFSQGVDFDLESFASPDSASRSDVVRRLLASAREGNVAIYTVDPRGLPGSTEPDLGASAAAGVAADPALDALRDLATATGGRAIVSTNQIDAALARVSDENRYYYLLGYEPVEPAGTRPRARTIEVRTQAPGVRLLHRRAYLPSTRATTQAAPSLASPLPVPDVTIAMAPVVFPDPAGGASLAVPFEISGAGSSDVRYTLVAVNGKGEQSRQLTGTVKAVDGVARGLVRQKLAPGRYQLRLQAESDGGSGVALGNAVMPAPGGDSAQCGGFMLLQPERGAPRPNVLRQFDAAQPVMVAMVVAARDAVMKNPLALVARRAGAPDAALTLSRPQQIGNGLWRLEAGIPPATFTGAVALTLLLSEQPVPGCHAELTFNSGR
jgi:VWFA-related protein